MGNLIAKILLFLFLIASPFLLIGFGVEVWKIISQITIRSPKVFAFFIGIGLFFPVWWLAKSFFQTGWHYLTTLEHECTHALVGLLFGKIPVSIRVSAWEGGEVKLRGGTNLWISLAPYFVPTLSFLIIILGLILGITNSVYFYGVLGWTIVFHLITNWQETSFRQTDLQQSGYLTSILVLPIANLLTYGAIFSLVFGNKNSFFSFWLEGGKTSWLAFRQIFRL
jgi:hypothetical protein